MSAYNNDDERRGRQRSDGRYAKQRSSGKPDHPKRNVNAAPLASFRSQRYILPENYNPGNGSPSRSSPGVPPPPPPRGDYYPGNGSSKSPGAPPPPPPPPPPYPRVRNSSFHSTSAAGNGLRGRSLSTARIAPSSQLKSRHGEDKDDANAEFTRRGRSLSTARSKPVTPLSPSALPLIDQNGKHRSRSRSKSKSRGPGSRSRSKSRGRQKSSKQAMAENSASSHRSHRGRSTSRSRSDNNTVTAASSSSTADRATTAEKVKGDQKLTTSTRKFVLEIGDNGGVVQVSEFSDNGALPANAESQSEQPAFIQDILRKYSADDKNNASSTRLTPLSPSALPLIDQNGKHRSRSRSKSKSRGGRQPKKKGDDSPTHKSSSRTKMRHSAPSRRTSESDNDVASQKSFEQVIVENSASSYHSRHSSSSRGRSTSRSRDNTNTGTAASPSPSTTDRATTVAKAKEDQSSTSTRKFVLEIGDRGGVVQVFEFSDNGALPANAESSQPKQLPEFIQNILRKYSADEKKNTSSTSTRSSSRGRSTSRSRGTTTAPREHSMRRKIMVESDAQDNIIQVLEFSDNLALPATTVHGALPAATARDESPFSKREREAYEKGKVTQKKQIVPFSSVSRGRDSNSAFPDDFVSRQKSPQSLSSRSASASLPRAIREAYDKGKVPHAKQVVPSTRRKDSNSVASPDDFVSRQKSFQSSSSRSASLPRAIREAYEKGKVPQEKQVPSSRGRGSNSGATPGDFVSRQKSSQPSRSASLPRARTGVALRTSLRSSRRGGRSNTVSSASVSFAIDNEGGKASKPSAFDTSETSFGSTESSCGSSDRSISFMTDQQDDRQSGDTRSALTSSSQDNSSAYPQQSRGRALDTKEKSDESSTRRSVSFIWDQGNRERPSERGRSNTVSSASVSFAIDNEGGKASKPSAFDTSETSFGSTESSRGGSDRSISFMMDQQDDRQSRDTKSALTMASSQDNSSAYPQQSHGTSAFDISEKSDESSTRRSVSFIWDQGNRERPSLTASSKASSQVRVPAYPQPPPRGKSTLDTSERSNESSTRRSVSFMSDQANRGSPLLTSSMPNSQVHAAYPKQSRGKSTLDTSERSESSSRRPVSFISDQADRESPPFTSSMPSQVHAAYPQRSRGKSTLDTSERSDDSSTRRSISFMSDQADYESPQLSSSMPSLHTTYPQQSRGKSGLDTSERSDEPSTRRSVSFMMDQDKSHTLRLSAMTSSMASSQVRAPAYPQPPPQGRTSYTRSNTGEYLTVFRRPRSLSKSRSTDCPSLVINDNSSLTSGSQDRPISAPPRGRSPAMTSPMASSQGRASAPRQARSLSRTRNAISRDVNFDPAASITNSPQGKYETVTRRNARPFEKILQKSMLSHSTEETFISALTNDEESFFSNHTTKAVGELDHLMNSTLTIFESKCDDEDPSLLSDATSLIDQQRPSLAPQENRTQPASTNGVKIHVMKDDYNDTREATNEERRSRIRRMLSRNASTKRRANLAGSKTLLDTSDRTGETMGTDGSSPAVLMESAHNSLLHHQQCKRGQEVENRQGSGRQKSRLPRFLHR
eukprot:CAMPEP_0202029916 /NCGR_PEP_ID=MMETSP0905-20130828/64222_1 /ASSEMBLY_ACC=CAM_ASM_000554 /TAXON_ID=420261 /ORGANISM="Thalassiosira antarctica, Strain CCMP982" /LENGTH=1562 /DNA_ID=CAMNT_0048593699 /DNA_START=44 /DNA_END=4733 /DNA_ORIENTATION=-